MKIFLAKLAVYGFYAAKLGWAQGIARANTERRQKKLEYIIKNLPREEGAILVALATTDKQDEIIDSMPPEMVQRLYDLTQCIQMELEDDLPS